MSVGQEGSNELEDPDQTIAELWPGGMPDSQAAIWETLPRHRKRLAVRRLRALSSFETKAQDGGRPRASIAELATTAGIGVSTFYAIAKRWRDQRSLDALGVHATSNGPNIPEVEQARHDMLAMVRATLADNPDLPVVEVRARLKDAIAKPTPTFSTVRRLVDQALRDLPPTKLFGADVVFDNAGLDLIDPPKTALRLYAAVDVGTGLLLGWNIESASDVTEGYRGAASHALTGRLERFLGASHSRQALSEFDLKSVPTTIPTKCEMHVLPSQRLRLIESSEGRFSTIEVIEDRSCGRSIVRALGERLYVVWLGSGTRKLGISYRTGRSATMHEVTGPLKRHIDQAISLHNRARLALLPRNGLPGTSDQSLNAVKDLLEPVANMKSDNEGA